MDTAIEVGFKLLDALLENLPKLINVAEKTGEYSKQAAAEKRARIEERMRRAHWEIRPDPS